MSGPYTNAVDERNTKELSIGNSLSKVDELAKMLQQKKQFEQEQAQQRNMQQAGFQHENQSQQAGFQQQKDMIPLQDESKLHVAQGESDIAGQASKDALDDLLSRKLPAGSGAAEDKGGASITRPIATGAAELKKQHQDTQQVNQYAKNLGKYSDLSGAAADLERVTNRDGSGGVFTNPNAQLLSGGKVVSSLPDAAIGLAEMTGVIPKGAAEERKAITKYRLAIGTAMGGARGMSPGVQASVKDATGQMASGDPALMAKGIRGAGRVIGSGVQTVQAGFAPEIRDQAHANAGMSDPMDFYRSITPEAGPPSNYKSAPAGSAQQAQQQSTPPAQRPTKTLRNKVTGQTKQVYSDTGEDVPQ